MISNFGIITSNESKSKGQAHAVEIPDKGNRETQNRCGYNFKHLGKLTFEPLVQRDQVSCS